MKITECLWESQEDDTRQWPNSATESPDGGIQAELDEERLKLEPPRIVVIWEKKKIERMSYQRWRIYMSYELKERAREVCGDRRWSGVAGRRWCCSSLGGDAGTVSCDEGEDEVMDNPHASLRLTKEENQSFLYLSSIWITENSFQNYKFFYGTFIS